MAIATYRIVLIGSGNVATQLGLALKKAGHEVILVVSKNKRNASALAKRTGSHSSIYLGDIPPQAEVLIIAVNDDAISTVVEGIKSTNALVLHTSGSTDLKVLAKFKKHGVLYPLQTLQKEKQANFSEIPLLVEGNTQNSISLIQNLAASISGKVIKSTSKKRKAIHLAAVFAGNFPNYLWGIASGLLRKEKLEINILEPLIRETMKKAMKGDPHNNQTGPASRNDKITLKIHLDFLKKNKDYQHIYRELSKAIVKKHTK